MDIDTLCREPVVFDPASADAVLAAFSGSAERILRELHQSRNQAERELNRRSLEFNQGRIL